MNNFFTIFKYNLINNLNLNKLKGKNKKNNPRFFLVIFLAIIIFGYFMGLMFMFGDAFNQAGEPKLILNLSISIGVFLSLLSTITSSNNYLFKLKDFDMLMSMPVNARTVVGAKLAQLLLINYLIFIVSYIPSLIVYAIYNSTTVVFWILALITFILLPLLPITMACLIGYLLNIIIPKFKFKNLFAIIGGLVFIVGIMFISMQSSMIAEDPINFTENIRKILKYSGEWAYRGMQGNYLDYIIFIVISIVPFVLLVQLLGIYFLRSNTKIKSDRSINNYNESSVKYGSQNKALIVKEIRRYFGSPMYVLNTIVGPIISIIFVVFFKTTFAKLDSGTEQLLPIEYLSLPILGIITFTLGLTSTTSSSISIEGKQFWILKSLPVKDKQVFMAKIFVNLLITIPIIIINTILCIILYDFKIIDYIMILIIPTLLALLMSITGLYVNLNFPKLNYDSDVKAVKQSVSVFVSLVISFILMTILIVVTILTIVFLTKVIYAYLFLILILAILNVILIILLYKHGSKLYKNIIV